MIRTTISICALLGGLLILSLVLREAAGDEPQSGPQLLAPENSSTADAPETKSTEANTDAPAGDVSAEAPAGDVSTDAPAGDVSTDAPAGEANSDVPNSEAAPASSDTIRVAVRTGERDTQSLVQQPGETSRRDQVDSAELDDLRDRMRQCLAYYYQRPEDAGGRSPWGIMHALIAYGVDTEIYGGGHKVNAIGWLCWNGPCRGQRLLELKHDRLAAKQGPGVQGHHGQFLAMLAQSRVPTDFPIKVNGREFTVADLIEFEQQGCIPKSELTFKLIALSHYLPSDTTWSNQHGEWGIERLIREELAQPIVGAACGGTHRMMGFSYAVRTREKRGEPITGQWKRASKFIDDFHEYTFQLQNRDGSFSTNWFEGRGDFGDNARRLQTTGHILEWLVYSLPKEQLRDRRVVRTVDYLTRLMYDNRNYKWEIGPKGHALHALVLYDQRVFGSEAGDGAYRVARVGEAK